MRKILTNITFFIAGFALFYCVSIFALNSVHWRGHSLLQMLTGNFRTAGAYGQTLPRFREIDNYKGIDVLVVGSSHAYRGFDPRLFSERRLTSFNMGSTSQSPLNTYYLLKQYLSGLNPKLVILELYPEILGQDGLESFYDLLVNLPFSIEICKMAQATKNPHAINALLGNYLGRWQVPLEQAKQSPIEGEQYITGGYCESFISRKIGSEKDRGVSKILKVQERQFEYVTKIVSLVRERGIELVVVIHPLPDDTLMRLSNYQEVTSRLSKLLKESDVDFFDFNDLLDLNQAEDFMDGDHLSANGVKKFNRALLEKLFNHPRYHNLLLKG